MTEGYVYQPYPRMLYHWKFGQTTVKSEQEEKQHLERGWVNTPDEVWKPKRMYHPTLKPDGHIFDSPEEEAEAVAKGWVDSPAKFPAVRFTEATSGKAHMSSPLTEEQSTLLALLAELYRGGRKSEFIISRSKSGSALVFLGGGENVEINFDDSDFLALEGEGLIRLYRDGRGDFHGKITGAGLDSTEQRREKQKESHTMNKRDVFVIYGRNDKLRSSMFDFLRSLDLNPLEWGELIAKTKSASPYIGQALEAGFKDVGAVIGLLTPDDVAFLHPDLWSSGENEYEKKPSPQARPNVLHSDRTVIVQIGDLRPFSDVAGRHVLRFDGSAAARTDLRNRLKNAGCEVKEHGTDWLKTGDFVITNLARYEVQVESGSVGAAATTQMSSLSKSDARRRSYGLAVSILRKLKGEFFQANGLPGHLWVSRENNWDKITRELGKTDGNTGRFSPYTEPSQFDDADEMKMEAAADILSLYLWAAKNNPDFEKIRAQHSLPDPERVAEYLGVGDLRDKYN